MRIDRMLKKVKGIIKKHSEGSEFMTGKLIDRMAIEICLYVNEIQYEEGIMVVNKVLKMIPDIFKDVKKGKGRK